MPNMIASLWLMPWWWLCRTEEKMPFSKLDKLFLSSRWSGFRKKCPDQRNPGPRGHGTNKRKKKCHDKNLTNYTVELSFFSRFVTTYKLVLHHQLQDQARDWKLLEIGDGYLCSVNLTRQITKIQKYFVSSPSSNFMTLEIGPGFVISFLLWAQSEYKCTLKVSSNDRNDVLTSNTPLALSRSRWRKAAQIKGVSESERERGQLSSYVLTIVRRPLAPGSGEGGGYKRWLR